MTILKPIILTAMLLVGASILFVQPRDAPPPLPDEVVIVDYWEKWGGSEAAAMQRVVELFNRTVGREKGIYVRYLSMSNIQQKTLVSTAAGVPPDVAGIFEAQVAQYAALDALEPLDGLAAEFGITPDLYKPVYWKMCSYRGRLWGLVSTPSALGLHWNKRIFRENADVLRAAGLDPEAPPKTTDELDRYAIALDTRDPATGRIDRAGFLPLEPNWFINYYPYYFGGDFYDADADRFTFATDPRVRRCMRWMQSYAKRLGPDAMNEFTSGFGQFGSTQNPFFAGKVAMTLQGPWMANFVHLFKPEMSEVIVPKSIESLLPRALRPHNYDWAVAAFPAEVDSDDLPVYCGADMLVIPRGARHPREAFEFIAFVNQQDVMEMLCTAQTKNSPLARVSDDFVRHHPNPYIDVINHLANSPLAKGPQQVPILPEMTEQVNYITQKLMSMQGTLDALLAESQRRMDEKYDLFRERQSGRAGVAGPR